MGNVLSGRQRNASFASIGGKKRGDSMSSRNYERRSQKMPYRVEHALELEDAPVEIQKKFGWSQWDKSINIYIKSDALTIHRRPISQSTDCARGKYGYREGLHIWEIVWTSNQRGTHAVVGVATEKAPTRKIGYCALVGSCNQTWGWDLGRNALRHDGEVVAPACLASSNNNDGENHNKLSYPPLDDYDTNFIVPTKFLCVLDMDAGTLGFIADGQWLGTAFTGLNKVRDEDGEQSRLYPIARQKVKFPSASSQIMSSILIRGHCEVTMRYVNGLQSNPLSLKEFARRSVRESLPQMRGRGKQENIHLPPKLANYCKDYGLGFDVRNKASYRYKFDLAEEPETISYIEDSSEFSLELSNRIEMNSASIMRRSSIRFVDSNF
ncbi:Oidioi.mRNA.OKI2018_I69.XSR.g15571.t1.cds [Oikopleura dioica]|uniref:Oidioi.mRNA.OKI2018_I69.XSR.g15571.t1.cds n=1 Tax=Oikopleura dioica TaxID=34765 RepID=A0ABN7SF76_OIKDI|nr:Oidioi.mRNA.OKI2018_I69.XSR.g15571.t1.cds [Oikopleura dioica]